MYYIVNQYYVFTCGDTSDYIILCFQVVRMKHNSENSNGVLAVSKVHALPNFIITLEASVINNNNYLL